MLALKSSAASLRSKQLWLAAAATLVVVALSDFFFYWQGWILWFGDAQAHLNISRSIIDSRTPGYDQLGTVWLPLLHLLCLPFVWIDALWSSGLAGTIPVSLCFLVAVLLFRQSARFVYNDDLAANVVLGCLLLNTNLLYLAAVPLTECVFFAGLALLLYAAVYDRFWIGVAAIWAMALTRYDGWFLIPFAALWFAYTRRRPLVFLAFAAAASLAPAYWIIHNWYETSNPLDFYNGPYSAQAIQGGRPYPGFHNWLVALGYYLKAGQLCSGWGLSILGILGFLCISNGRMLRPLVFLLLTPLFYVWSIHSSGLPIFLPQLPPHGYYNSRYGSALAVWAAFAAGAIVTVIPCPYRRYAPAIVAITALFQWSPIVIQEAHVNSRSRFAWTRAAAEYLEAHRRPDEGITASFGDLTGIFCQARIPLSRVLHEGNGPLWLATKTRPDLIHTEPWVVSQNESFGPVYQLRKRIDVEGAPPLFLLRRSY